jgi:hypothetical protein
LLDDLLVVARILSKCGNIAQIFTSVNNQYNEAKWLGKTRAKIASLGELPGEQSRLWIG